MTSASDGDAVENGAQFLHEKFVLLLCFFPIRFAHDSLEDCKQHGILLEANLCQKRNMLSEGPGLQMLSTPGYCLTKEQPSPTMYWPCSAPPLDVSTTIRSGEPSWVARSASTSAGTTSC